MLSPRAMPTRALPTLAAQPFGRAARAVVSATSGTALALALALTLVVAPAAATPTSTVRSAVGRPVALPALPATGQGESMTRMTP